MKAKHPQLLWVNNIDTSFADEIQNISNGRQIEGSYNLAESPGKSTKLSTQAMLPVLEIYRSTFSRLLVISGLNSIIDGTFPIANYVNYIASWERTALKPTLLHVSVNSLIQGGW